jgi:hypothetical protein
VGCHLDRRIHAVLPVSGSLLLARYYRVQGCARASSQIMWRAVAMVLTCVGFIVASYAIFQPHEAAQFAVFPALLFAAIYIGLGIWRGMRSVAGRS